MGEGIIWFLFKGIILTEVLTNALRSWEIFTPQRKWLKTQSDFLRRLLDCFECTSVWVGVVVIIYLTYFEVPLVTYALVFHRGACFIRNLYDLIDSYRAVKQGEL